MTPTVALILFFSALCLHWVADFVCQSDKMANGKSHDNVILTLHCIVYTLVMYLGVLTFMVITMSPLIAYAVPVAIYLFVTHFVVDYFTSRLNAYLWRTEQRHWFFVSVGFDQVIHYGTLLCLLLWLIR